MFELQLGHPRIIHAKFTEFTTVNEVFLTLFRPEEESIYLFWHQIPVRFRYREDIHQNINNIIAMAWVIQKQEQGETKIELVNQLISIRWEVKWLDDNLKIVSRFTAHDELYAPYADSLSQYAELNISKTLFLNEWKTLLHQIIICFREGHIVIRDGTERRKFEMLKRIENEIQNYGKLYLQPL